MIQPSIRCGPATIASLPRNNYHIELGSKDMTSLQRIQAAMACQPVDRVPWVPFVGSHAAHLLNMTATEYLQSEESIINGVNRAIESYAPDGIPVVFDLQVEAEALGCELQWADENPPAVVSHPLANGTTLSQLKVPDRNSGRIAPILSATQALRRQHPEIALYGLITGPFTLALHLRGTSVFMDMFDDPAGVQDLLAFCKETALAMSRYYCDAGCDVIAVVDPMTSQIGPEQFVEFVTPHVTEIFDFVRENHALSSFFVCGHAQQNIPAMCDCHCDNISIDENIPLDFVRDECRKRNMSFGGNLQLTRVLLLGAPLDAQRNALACLDTGGDTGFVLAPGCDIPYATPQENLVAVTKIVHDPYNREVADTLAHAEDDSCLDMEDYGQADKVIIDIITLDSEACAPCQYMVDAVRKVTPEFQGIVEWREHKIKHPESLAFMTGLMVHNVPTICIDGQITFVSRIPPKDQLIAAIQKRINEKFRMRIQKKKAKIHVLGQAGEAIHQTLANIKQAIRELGEEVDVEQVPTEEALAQYGITQSQTPAVILTHSQLKSVRRVPEVVVIKEWLKTL